MSFWVTILGNGGELKIYYIYIFYTDSKLGAK